MDITELLAFSAKRNASDLHLSADLPPMVRVEGDIHRLDMPALEDREVRGLIEAIMPEERRREFAAGAEVDFAFEVPGLSRFRANVFRQRRGAGAVFRVIPAEVPSLSALGLGDIFRRLALLSRGLVLVTGPTGSGKSTTLAAMIDHLNESRAGHVLTIEDPVEFVHRSKRCLVNQREVHRDTCGFAQALRSALREDPDVILVGEMRDLETMRLALTAAETGHLVFATLHTASAVGTVGRIVEAFPGEERAMVRTMLAESLQAVISQTLLKRREGGRLAAHEILLATTAVRNLIREDRTAQLYSAIQTGGQLGMQTLEAALARLVAEGVVTPEEARSQARDGLMG